MTKRICDICGADIPDHQTSTGWALARGNKGKFKFDLINGPNIHDLCRPCALSELQLSIQAEMEPHD